MIMKYYPTIDLGQNSILTRSTSVSRFSPLARKATKEALLEKVFMACECGSHEEKGVHGVK